MENELFSEVVTIAQAIPLIVSVCLLLGFALLWAARFRQTARWPGVVVVLAVVVGVVAGYSYRVTGTLYSPGGITGLGLLALGSWFLYVGLQLSWDWIREHRWASLAAGVVVAGILWLVWRNTG